MFPECPGIAEVKVQVVAILRLDADISHFQVFITEHFFNSRQSIGFLIGQFGLKAGQYEIGSGRTITHGTHIASSAHILTLITGCSYRPSYKLVVIFAEYGEVPVFRRHQAIGQTGNILACFLGDSLFLLFLGKQRGVRTVESIQYMIESQHLYPIDAVVHSQRTIPIVIVRP